MAACAAMTMVETGDGPASHYFTSPSGRGEFSLQLGPQRLLDGRDSVAGVTQQRDEALVTR